jgi:hypothetical protein
MKIILNEAPSSPVDVCHLFGGTYCLHPQGQRVFPAGKQRRRNENQRNAVYSAYLSILKMDALRSSETLAMHGINSQKTPNLGLRLDKLAGLKLLLTPPTPSNISLQASTDALVRRMRTGPLRVTPSKNGQDIGST